MPRTEIIFHPRYLEKVAILDFKTRLIRLMDLINQQNLNSNTELQVQSEFKAISTDFALAVGHSMALLKDIASGGYLEPALLHCGGIIRAVDDIMQGYCINAFATMTVGGHHAGPTGHWGFCYLNDIACAVHQLRTQHQIKRVLYIDQDFHHGDGTEKFFRLDKDFGYICVHAQHSGEQPGVKADKEHYYLDIILPRGLGGDMFASIIKEALDVMLNRWHFQPEFIINYAGYDAHELDGFNNFTLKVDYHAFIELTNVYVKLAEHFCHNRLLCIAGGGYSSKDPDAAAICSFNSIMVLANRWDHFLKRDSPVTSTDVIAMIKVNSILKELVRVSK